jgi:hypothetical protein
MASLPLIPAKGGDMVSFYKAYRDAMKTGDLIETAASTILGRMIRWVTKKDVNHSAFLAHLTDVSDRVYLVEALSKGIELNRLSRSIDGYKGTVWWYPLKPEWEPARKVMLKFALDACAQGIGYDYTALIKNMFSKVSRDAKSYFCSEFYDMALVKAGMVDGLSKARRPGEFAMLELHEPRRLIHTSKRLDDPTIRIKGIKGIRDEDKPWQD